MSAWKSTADELPDDETTVLVALEDGEVWPAYHYAGSWIYVTGDPISASRVTHWMDMPEHPNDLGNRLAATGRREGEDG